MCSSDKPAIQSSILFRHSKPHFSPRFERGLRAPLVSLSTCTLSNPLYPLALLTAPRRHVPLDVDESHLTPFQYWMGGKRGCLVVFRLDGSEGLFRLQYPGFMVLRGCLDRTMICRAKYLALTEVRAAIRLGSHFLSRRMPISSSYSTSG